MHFDAIYTRNSASDDYVFNDIICLYHFTIRKLEKLNSVPFQNFWSETEFSLFPSQFF